MSTAESFPAALGRLPPLARANLAALGGFVVLLCWLFLPQWRHNPDLAHGLLMPVVFLVLLRESRAAGPRRYLAGGAGAAAAVGALALAGLAVLSMAGLYAAAVDWSNALVDFLLATALSLLLGAALVSFADQRVRLLPCNWTAVVAIGLWPLTAPIPSGMYARLTLALQLWISTGVMDALQLLGVAAHRQGNIIELATCRVGVEEACSGVRSLVSCIFVALFFSASIVRQPWARAVVIGVAGPLALAMNFLRALTLTLLANGGVSIAGFWHDMTGYAVLLVTAGLLAGLAWGLQEEGESGKSKGESPEDEPSGIRPSTFAFPLSPSLLSAALATASLLVLFFGLNTHPAVNRSATVPDLASLMPAVPAGWTAASAANLERFRDQLQTDVLVERTYLGGTASQPVQIAFYLAYWRPGQAPVSLVDAHTPDACWPGAGWVAQPSEEGGPGLSISGRSLAPGESRLFANEGVPRQVWFWHLYNGQRLPYRNPYSAVELLRLAWHFGFRHNGDQLFVTVSSNRPWNEIAREPLLQEFFAHLQPLGL